MADRIGQQLGNYRLTRLLGRGGFAEVYLGEHHRLKSRAAIKVLHTQLSDEDITTFLNEAQTIARLEHPNIIQVLDFDITDGVPFLVMSFASEGTLRQRHPKGTQLSPEIILPYVKQVADALHYAHSEKLIHRDVKPENMLLGRRNQVLLSDFGIAFILQSSHYQSLLNTAGTVSYMAPEQIQGKPRPASDQYALGILIYEWLSGNRPFQGSFTEIATQHVLAPPPPLREKVPGIAPALEQVVLKALAKDPHQRFANMQEFASAFEQAYHSPLTASPTILLNQPPASPPAPRSPFSFPQNPNALSNVAPQSYSQAPLPVQPPASYSPTASPNMDQAPTRTVVPPYKPQRQKWNISRQAVLVSVIGLILVGGIAIGLLTGGIQSLFRTGVGGNGQHALSGTIVSVNASTHTVVLNVNGQQDTITNVPDNVIQLLQGQVGKMYGIQVTQNSDGSFSIVGGTDVTPENNQGTPEVNNTPGSNQTPTTVTGSPAQGTIQFNGNVQSSGTNSLVVSIPGGGTLSVSTNSSTDLGDFNNSLPAVNTQVLVVANANTDGSYTATKIGNVSAANASQLNTITFQGRTTAAVGSDNVIHFTVGTKSYSFIIPSTADLTAFHGNAQSIQSGTQVQVQVQYNGSTPTVILVGLAQ